ncbi:Dph6-related ATP pyrophosphatase [Hydrogenivirga sp.]
MTFANSFILWSGGKDSYLSYRKAVSRGFSIDYALSYVDERSGRLIGCYIRESVIRAQVEALGLEFVPVYGSKRKGNFEESLFSVLRELRPQAGVFGDIYRREHRSLLERVCAPLGIRPVFPLWHMEEEVILSEVLGVASPVVVCRRVRRVPPRFLGRELGQELIDYLRSGGYSVSGENGEYQTFVARCEDFQLELNFIRRFRKSYYECIDIEVR